MQKLSILHFFSSSSFLLLLFALKNTHLRIEREASEDHRSVDLGTHLFFFSRFFLVRGRGGGWDVLVLEEERKRIKKMASV